MILRSAASKAACGLQIRRSCQRNFHPKGSKSARSNIINPNLCDDVLDRLKPTLPPPNTCDLIDVNVGNGLWSEKLHEVLKPRRHILVESQPQKYGEFLNRLVRQDPSRYVIAPSVEHIFHRENDFLSPETKSFKQIESGQCNPSILMTINLTGRNEKTSFFTGSPSSHFFYRRSYASLDSLRLGYGSYRVLAWVPEAEKSQYVPRSVGLRTKQSLLLEMTSKVREIASSGSQVNSPRNYRRWYDLDMENLADLLEKEKMAKVQVPSQREYEVPIPPLMSLADPHPDTFQSVQYSSDAGYVDDWIELDMKMKQMDWYWYKNYRPAPGTMKTNMQRKTPSRPERARWLEYLGQARRQHRSYTRTVESVKELREIDHRWRELFQMNEDPDDVDRSRLQRRTEEAHTVIRSRDRDSVALCLRAVDDYRAYDLNPPVMSWNQRLERPLALHNKEFDSYPLFLLDLMPKPQFWRHFDSQIKLTCLDYILKWFGRNAADSLQEALYLILQDAVAEFVQTIPDLRNPARGGYHDLNYLRPRTLPADVIADIALAYERWPFRPSDEHLLRTTGKNGQDFIKDRTNS